MTTQGKLIIIGGAEDKGTLSEATFIQKNNLNFFSLGILKKILVEIDNDNPVIEVITTASIIPEEVGEMYITTFAQIGATNVRYLDIRSREDVNNPEYVERVTKADAVLFSGGNQLRLSSILGGTQVHDIILKRYREEEGFVVAGTSAGAAACSNTMIYEGSSSEALLKGSVKITTGLGFINDVIIDSHFVKRGRFGRLFAAIASNPGVLGIGLGEDTGLLITDGKNMEAVGSGLVVFVDGRHIVSTNVYEIPDGSPISVENLIVHVLAKGNGFDLTTRKMQVQANHA